MDRWTDRRGKTEEQTRRKRRSLESEGGKMEHPEGVHQRQAGDSGGCRWVGGQAAGVRSGSPRISRDLDTPLPLLLSWVSSTKLKTHSPLPHLTLSLRGASLLLVLGEERPCLALPGCPEVPWLRPLPGSLRSVSGSRKSIPGS